MSSQLPLPVGLRDGNTLETFLPRANPEAHAAVSALLAGTEPFVYLWGPPDSGRSHLLEAAADAAARCGMPPVYLAAAPLREAGTEALAAMVAGGAVICIDDIDSFAGDASWEEAFFHMFNAARAGGARLLVSARGPASSAGFALADLRSRLGSGLTIGMGGLDDALRLAILQFRATRRGLELPDAVGQFLLARNSRRLADLIALLAVLDRAAMVHKRRLTVPFVRQVLGA